MDDVCLVLHSHFICVQFKCNQKLIYLSEQERGHGMGRGTKMNVNLNK